MLIVKRGVGVYYVEVKRVSNLLDSSRSYHKVRRTRRADLMSKPYPTADSKEQCESSESIVEYLHKVREQSQQVYDEILYVEQPAERDLTEHRWDLRSLAKLKPVLIDNSLATVEDFKLVMELGWSGIALKSRKCLSSDLLFIPIAELHHIRYVVQDLTNPSLALLETVGLAAHTYTMIGVEANSRRSIRPCTGSRIAWR